jgi:FkbM family methyltransferase
MRVRISAQHLKPRALLEWEYGWKAEVMRRILARRGGDFIDVGANVGQTLLDFFATGSAGRYFGFEPFPNSFASLSTLVRENAFEHCVILPIGLSDASSVTTLYSDIGANTDSGATLIRQLRRTRRLVANAVYCCRFDDLRGDLEIDSIGLIKIDVEGAELKVLQGMEATMREMRVPLLCEILYADAHADMGEYAAAVDALRGHLERLHYAAYRVEKDSGGRLVGLSEAPVFPVQVWTAENAAECDYLLVPIESAPLYVSLLEARTRADLH